MPRESEDLNEKVCSPNNRQGFLCEKCIKGFGPTAYFTECKNCTKHSLVMKIAHFLTLKLLPITVMFILLVFFRINIT